MNVSFKECARCGARFCSAQCLFSFVAVKTCQAVFDATRKAQLLHNKFGKVTIVMYHQTIQSAKRQLKYFLPSILRTLLTSAF